ncbi:MAG: hypothetical protein ACPL1F_01480 [bacterium]
MINLFNLNFFVITNTINLVNYNVLLGITGVVIPVLITEVRLVPEVYGDVFIGLNTGLPHRFLIFRENKPRFKFKLYISIKDYMSNRERLGISNWTLQLIRDLEFNKYTTERVLRFFPLNIDFENIGYLENEILILNVEGFINV